MPFPRHKVYFNRSFGSIPREVSITDPVTGVVETRFEDCNKPLPSAEMFQIQNMLKAGVHLDEVNTKVISSGIDVDAVVGAVDTVVKAASKSRKSTKTQETQEVNDEN